jgi:hypothetical protein
VLLCLFSPLPFFLVNNPPGSLPVPRRTVSLGVGTLFSSDTERMAPLGRQILACWNNRSHVLQEKNPIYRHCTSKVICAGTTSYLLLGSVRVNVLREIDGWVQSQVCKCIELLSTYYSV